MIVALQSRIASPSQACTASLRLPSRNAAAMPIAKRLAVNTTMRPSANDSAAEKSHTTAGAAKG